MNTQNLHTPQDIAKVILDAAKGYHTTMQSVTTMAEDYSQTSDAFLSFAWTNVRKAARDVQFKLCVLIEETAIVANHRPFSAAAATVVEEGLEAMKKVDELNQL
jgi:hypothetical protein